ncbi:[LysW]-aminoadipate semialdehyde/glutamate semialdehyde transaminase [Sulfolobus acidocaldarius]|uniref:[LysW]-aminoadipate semialdehyde/glutamate semialdehyde transaminase n=4 Tax=Sulfolobus acidocaldarius TaxID=2285 RepID=LYSJ_SULAC|nr:[LysW]-aminoadipate semialdehyde/glutamate semialdehyde transaminase [Sulfolobus acidocaldarius]Q4JAP8.1 RecName: Full=[LysW]-aminoadipate semialdehyde/glutamate semialdehyde transaminase [Sulfolobus acidocaldarius DSM 639]AAY80131.1 acetylornithine aminotransferase [Sulfolobus acidocaldarius DSM 639]AGE70706.1 acetylornithine aminotransferase [Sulfolobus acidocaldarius N8]AGE72978.1 acetylornithine aminotransferase [Sulfolobus acidocaldarius Ron12/I]ALU28955.1 acetyl-lysine aminotransferas
MKLIQLYGDRGLTIVKGEAQYVWDIEGRRYLDFHTGIGVAFLGHRNPIILEYLKNQLENISILSTSFSTPIKDEMLQALDKVKPDKMDNAMLLNSGTEAVEAALKTARKITGRKKIIAFKNAFHGRTAGSLSVTWNKKYREPFEPLVGPVEFLTFNNIEDLSKIDNETAAVIVEPIQGESGVIPANIEFMKALKEKTENTGSLLIFDEIQTGFGRTGKLWAYKHYNIVPDILTAGKAIGGGFPVSVVFLPDHIANKLEEGDHGSTYGGNPMAMAAVTAACKVIEKENVVEQANQKGQQFSNILVKNLADLKVVREVRGKGLMIGIDIRFQPGQVLKYLQEKGILAVKAGSTVIRFLPSYLITYENMEEASNVLREGLLKIENKAVSS